MKKILIINPFGIGDVLFTTCVIANIKENWQDCFIGYWCNQRTEQILKNNPQIDKTFAMSRGDLKKISKESKIEYIKTAINLFRSIKKESFEAALDYSLDYHYSFAAKFAGIKKRIGFNYKNRGLFLTDKIQMTGYTEKHVVDYYLDLLPFLSIRPKQVNMRLNVSPEAGEKAKKRLEALSFKREGPVIGMICGGGASWGEDAQRKQWSEENFSRLAQMLISYLKARILILGDESEKIISEAIVRKTGGKAIDLTGQTDLEELSAIISNLDAVVGNDSGPMHIAVALNKKTLSFFGPVDPKVYGPYPHDDKRHLVLKGVSDCSPCYRNFRLQFCLKDKACLESIDVQNAYQTLASLLAIKGDN